MNVAAFFFKGLDTHGEQPPPWDLHGVWLDPVATGEAVRVAVLVTLRVEEPPLETLRLAILLPDGGVKEIKMETKLKPGRHGDRQRWLFTDWRIPSRAGRYRLEIHVNGDLAFELPFDAQKARLAESGPSDRPTK